MSEEALHGKDLSPIEGIEGERDHAWLRELQRHVRSSDHVVRLGDAELEPDPLVSADAEGFWRCGRYIGSISFRGRSLNITPRFGFEVIAGWAGAQTNVMIAPAGSRHEAGAELIPYLLALLWCRELAQASRHGLPFLREDRAHRGLRVRGRVAVVETARHRARGRRGIASVAAERSLGNDISRTLVCAQRALVQMNGGDWWMTERAKELMPHLWAAVGTRPRLPHARDLRRIRYTPIRRPFRALVEHSWRIARQRGFKTAGTEGEAEGLLLDVAELWERFILAATRQAALPGTTVVHGTREALTERSYLMRSERDPEVGLGRLLPDVIVRSGERVEAIIDAKYKRLTPRVDAPMGVERSDAYQIAGYLNSMRAPQGTLGMLAYPAEPDESGQQLPIEEQPPSPAEAQGPWRDGAADRIVTRRLPVELEACASAMRWDFREGVGGATLELLPQDVPGA